MANLLLIGILTTCIYLLYRSASLFFLPKFTKRWTILKFCGIALALLLLPNFGWFSANFTLQLFFSLFCYFLALMVLTRLFYGEGKLLYWLGFSLIVMLCCQILSYGIVRHFIVPIQTEPLLLFITVILQGAGPPLIQLGISYLLLFTKKQHLHKISVLTCCGLALLALFLLVNNTYSLIFAPLMLIAICGLVIGVILVFFTLRLLQQEKKNYQQQQQLLKKEGNLLKAQANQTNYQEIRELIHSFNRFALQLDQQIAANENTAAQAALEAFLLDLNQNLAQIHTSSSALDALLYYYLKKQPQIDFDYRLPLLTAAGQRAENDLLIFSGQILEFCIQAFPPKEHANGKIRLTLTEENQRLVLEVHVTPPPSKLKMNWQQAQFQERFAEMLAPYSGEFYFDYHPHEATVSLLLFLPETKIERKNKRHA